MLIHSTGKFTGQIVKSIKQDGAVIGTIHYSAEECRQELHYHKNPHICFLFQGGDIETRNNFSYRRETSDLYFYYAGEKHATVSRKDISKQTVIEFEKDFLEKYRVSESKIESAVNDSLDSKFLILKIQQEMFIDDACSQIAIQSLLLNLVEHSNKKLNNSAPEWVKVLDDFLNDNWNEPVTLKELSLATKAHPVTISKYFPKYFFCTLGEYLRKLKVDKSIPLIKNSNQSLTEIAHHCGFFDQSHFTKTFKQMTGFLPKEFRSI